MGFVISKSRVASILLSLCIYNGLLVAIVKFLNIDLRISPINITVLLFLPILLITFLTQKKNVISNFAAITFALFIFILFKLISLSFISVISFTDIMVYFVYLCALFSMFFFISINTNVIPKLINIFRKSFFIIGSIYFIQYFFHAVLPEAFTEIPNLFIEAGVERYTRELEDFIIYRPNALIGNPINLGYFLNLLLSIELLFWNNTRSKKTLIKLIILGSMIFLLFSRANILLALSLIYGNILLTKGVIKSVLRSLVILILFFSTIALMYGKNRYVTYAVDRFTGEETYASASTEEHFKDYQNAYYTFLENPILGISPDQEISQNIITDGAIFIGLLHFGSLGFIILIIAYIMLVNRIKYIYVSNKNFSPQFILIITILPYSVLNSAILDKGILIVSSIYFGIFLNISYQKKESSRYIWP
ncbi:hypothetical protein [Zhouia amylolytica]|uniref:Uncharacterized protein n=1 Tax=Zhouia amylolytica AD3 TaxID=1286632 RepID=W2UR62_9FLAO|nr:hypothetical protein [Zhouia amylolytica]ETN95792.1 hypothetical protein P278_15140 [Zhouia amylolytica AD3]